MDRSLTRGSMHFRGLLWRECPKHMLRASGGSSTSSKVWRCEKTLGRGNLIVHQWTRGAKTVDGGTGARSGLNPEAGHGSRLHRRPCCERRSTVPGGTARGGNDKYTIWRSRDTSKWSRPLPGEQSPTASFDSKGSHVAGCDGQVL